MRAAAAATNGQNGGGQQNGGGTPPAYQTTAKDYDGSTMYSNAGSFGLATIDGKKGTVSVWFRVDGGNGTNRRIISSDNGTFTGMGLSLNTSNQIEIQGNSTAGVNRLDMTTTATFVAGASWYQVLASWDVGSSLTHLYINGISDKIINVGPINATIGYTLEALIGAARNAFVFKWNGCLSEIFFHDDYIDLSIAGNRALFINASNNPVSLGTTGQIPFGIQARFYSPTGDGAVNVGSIGNLTNNATLGICSSSPSGSLNPSGPTAFTFTDQTAIEHSTVCTSALIYIVGVTGTLTATVTGGTISVNGGVFTAGPTSITNGQSLQARATSSASDSTAVNVVVTINGISDTFTITTGDSVPAAFTFTDVTGVITGSTQTSAAIMVSGLTISSPISVTGDTGAKYSINGAAATASAGVVYNGDLVQAVIIASSSASTAANCTVTINGVSDMFTATTGSAVTTIWNSANSYTPATSAAPPPAIIAIDTYTVRLNANKVFQILAAADALAQPINVLTNTSFTSGFKYFEIQLDVMTTGSLLIGLYDNVTGNLFQYFFANTSGGSGASFRSTLQGDNIYYSHIDHVRVLIGGGGYSGSTQVVVTTPTSGTPAVLSRVISGGVITSVGVINGGSQYLNRTRPAVAAVDSAGSSGFRKNINAYSSSGVNGVQGDVFGCAMNRTGNLMYVHRNGVYIGGANPAAGTGGTALDAGAHATFAVAGGLPSGNQIIGAFRQSEFVYAPPAGYSAWDST